MGLFSGSPVDVDALEQQLQQKMAAAQAEAARAKAIQDAKDAQQAALNKTASDYQKNKGSIINDQESVAGSQARQGLASQMAGIKSNMNSRGMLYSGANQGAQSNARAQFASNLASTNAGINQNVNQVGEQLNNQAINAGMQSAGAAQQQAGTQYGLAQNEFGNQNAGAAAAGNAIGGLIGNALSPSTPSTSAGAMLSPKNGNRVVP